MIIDPKTGKPTATDGPTGREIQIKEICKDGKFTWGLVPVGGEFDGDEIVQVLSMTIHGMATRARAEFAHHKAMQQVKTKMEDLKKEK